LPADTELLASYGQIVVGRRVNHRNSALVRQALMAVYPSSHGQEACQVEAELCRADGDWIRWGTTTGWRTKCWTAER
jgi:pyruvate dehydrogenase E1 component alpha subunit